MSKTQETVDDLSDELSSINIDVCKSTMSKTQGTVDVLSDELSSINIDVCKSKMSKTQETVDVLSDELSSINIDICKSTMLKTQETVDVLSDELSSVKIYMEHNKTFLPIPNTTIRKKNTIDSINYRQIGNDLFKSGDHRDTTHEQIWRLYTQSIALAPNKSEELACGYGNRSALLFHLKLYRDCMKDCDKAIKLTKSDSLKTKLLTRKAECLVLLEDPVAEHIIKKAIQSLEKLEMGFEVQLYNQKLKHMLSRCSNSKGNERNYNNKLMELYIDELSNFPRSKEIPCASESVAIKYSEQFGRHLVATKDIKSGEILAVERNYYTFLNKEGRHLHCSNCAKWVLSSIPCEHCIFDVYCSESCRSEAWKKYHEWECPVIPHIVDLDNDDFEASLIVMRLAFTAINEVGGMDNMKKLLIELNDCKDPRTVGFSQGVFDVNSARSVYSLMKQEEFLQDNKKDEWIGKICAGTYLLAMHSDFFGQKMNTSALEIFENSDVMFFAALLLRTVYLMNNNVQFHSSHRVKPGDFYATSLAPFSSLINHTCDPNIHIIDAQNNTVIVYAVQPVEKGTQLAVAYSGLSFLSVPKQYRQDQLRKAFKFTCQCLACTENWSDSCLPQLEMIKTVTPELESTCREIMEKMLRLRETMNPDGYYRKRLLKYSPDLMKDLVSFLRCLAEKITVHCVEYHLGIEYLYDILRAAFGSFLFTM